MDPAGGWEGWLAEKGKATGSRTRQGEQKETGHSALPLQSSDSIGKVEAAMTVCLIPNDVRHAGSPCISERQPRRTKEDSPRGFFPVRSLRVSKCDALTLDAL